MTLPKIDDFFLEVSLYKKFPISDDDGVYLYNLLFFNDRVDCFCPSCNINSIFKGTNEKRKFGSNNEKIDISSCKKKFHDVQLKTDTEKKLQQQRIALLDKQIDTLVYEIYDLTDEEINIVEEWEK